jgi:hypothetical protein
VRGRHYSSNFVNEIRPLEDGSGGSECLLDHRLDRMAKFDTESSLESWRSGLAIFRFNYDAGLALLEQDRMACFAFAIALQTSFKSSGTAVSEVTWSAPLYEGSFL